MEQTAYLTVDLSAGDTGKGSWVDAFVRHYEAKLVLRSQGGAQAAHHVVLEDGQSHRFSQFCSGLFVSGVRGHLGPRVITDPHAMLIEARKLEEMGVEDCWDRMTLDGRALIITPFHRAVNRLRERARGAGRHGSCGMGIGETVSDSLKRPDLAIRLKDLSDREQLLYRLRNVMDFKRAQVTNLIEKLKDDPDACNDLRVLHDPSRIADYLDLYAEFVEKAKIVSKEYLQSLLARIEGPIVCEAAQGVLLDEWRGFHPHTTWSTCTLEPINELLDECGFDGKRIRIGLVRAYATRHGAGPFVSESAVVAEAIEEAHNETNEWQGAFRFGWFDAVATRYAIDACGGIDALAVSCLDQMPLLPLWKICRGYAFETSCFLSRDLMEYFAHTYGPDPKEDPYAPWNVFDIKLGPSQDLEHQARLTDYLLKASPDLLEIRPVGSEEEKIHLYLKWIESLLDVRVKYASYGSTAKDKYFL
jgi:adenylosuccinate synthase